MTGSRESATKTTTEVGKPMYDVHKLTSVHAASASGASGLSVGYVDPSKSLTIDTTMLTAGSASWPSVVIPPLTPTAGFVPSVGSLTVEPGTLWVGTSEKTLSPLVHEHEWSWGDQVGDKVSLFCRCGVIEWNDVDHEHSYMVDSVVVPQFTTRTETYSNGTSVLRYDQSGARVDRTMICRTCGTSSAI